MAYGNCGQQSSAPIGKAASLPPAFSPCQARTLGAWRPCKPAPTHKIA